MEQPTFMPPMKSNLPASEPADSIGGSAPRNSLVSKAWDQKHAIATLMLALSFAGDVASRYGAAPVTESQTAALEEPQKKQPDPSETSPKMPVPAESPKKNEEPPPFVPYRPPVPSRYEIEIRTAWGIEGGSDVHRKRLIFLYRASINSVKTAKTMAEFKAAFAAEEKRLDMQAKLPFTRAAAAKEWLARLPALKDALAEKERAAIAELLTETIAILDKL